MEKCKEYTGVFCVDGNCPMANAEEYEERGYDVIKNCGECYYYRGCEDCAWNGTTYCNKSKGLEEEKL